MTASRAIPVPLMPPPMMMTFDASSRETCVLSRSRTNTPLQALALLNDVTFVEAARVLAGETISRGGVRPADRLAWAFRQLTSRLPTVKALGILEKALGRSLARYQSQLKSQHERVNRDPPAVPK